MFIKRLALSLGVCALSSSMFFGCSKEAKEADGDKTAVRSNSEADGSNEEGGGAGVAASTDTGDDISDGGKSSDGGDTPDEGDSSDNGQAEDGFAVDEETSNGSSDDEETSNGASDDEEASDDSSDDGDAPEDGGVAVDIDPAVDIEEVILVSTSAEVGPDGGTLSIGVSCTDSDGEFLGDQLPQEAFVITEERLLDEEGNEFVIGDGDPSPISVTITISESVVIEPEPDVPFTAVALLDGSGSLADRLQNGVVTREGTDNDGSGRTAGTTALVEILDEDDQLAIMQFGSAWNGGNPAPVTTSTAANGDMVNLVATEELQGFTTDDALLTAALDEIDQDGDTPLWLSITETLGLFEGSTSGSRALVVMTDGENSITAQAGGVQNPYGSDTSTVDDAIAAAQEREVPVYAIGLGADLDFSELARLGEETGGGFLEAPDADALAEAFAGVATGATVGQVNLSAQVTFDVEVPAGRYRLVGTLTSLDGTGETIATPFSITAEIAAN